MLPAVIVALAALSSGAVAGRKLLRERIHKQKSDAIAEAAKLVKARIHAEAGTYVATTLKRFAENAAAKVVLLMFVISLAAFGVLGGTEARWSIAGLLLAFTVYDAWNLWPVIRLSISELRRHGWRPRRTLAEVIAANAFDQVLTEAKAHKLDWWNDLALKLAGQNAEQVSLDIAQSVANIARETSWEDLKPYVTAAAVKLASMMALYTLAVLFLLHVQGR